MPRQNRVTPFGEIVAIPERGTMMGNRGRLHDDAGRIRRPWEVKRWLICLLEFNGRSRQVMTPGRSTELFFLDEATALSAGHRPCFECRRKAFEQFTAAWASGNHIDLTSGRPSARSIDLRLHEERLDPDRSRQTHRALIDDLPDGVFLELNDDEGLAHLLWEGRVFAWTPGGYKIGRRLPTTGEVSVLTPRSTVAAIRSGYVPSVHTSVMNARTA